MLRGTSGAGKTVAMQQEEARLKATGRRTHWFDLASYTEVPWSDIAKAAATADSPCLFIDGADIVLSWQPALLVQLGRFIAELHDAGRVFSSRIAIRAGIAATALVERLRESFGAQALELQLAPLSLTDVRLAALAEGIDHARFLEYVDALGTGPLAAQPPTLRMLFVVWQRAAAMPIRREVLYTEGCLELFREVDPVRTDMGGGDDPKFIGAFSPEERMAVACRIASLMVFSNKAVLDLQTERDGTDPVLFAQDLVGGVEPTERDHTPVTLQAIREVVRTGLFRSDGVDRFTFAHPSFMDFLAARFVLIHKMTAEQVMPLLVTQGVAASRQIGGDRIEVASWLAADSAELFDLLADLDPEVLLRSKIPARRNAQRMKLAEALLRASVEGKLDLDELELTQHLVLVSNPALAARISEVVCDRSLPLAQRKFAIRLVEYCGGDSVAPDLIEVASNSSEDFDLRFSALVSLKHVDIKDHGDALIALARAGLVGDRDHQLRAMALRLVYPSLIDTAAAIRMLVPFRAEAFGSPYDVFCLWIGRNFPAGDLVGALRALADVAQRRYGRKDNPRNLVLLIGAIAKRAFARLAEADVREALATMIVAIPDNFDWATWSDTLHIRGMPSAATTPLRRKLLMAILKIATSGSIAKPLLEIPFLVRDGDLAWLCAKACSSSIAADATISSTLAVEVARAMPGRGIRSKLQKAGLRPAHVRQVMQAAIAMPPLFARWRPPKYIKDESEQLIASLESSLAPSTRDPLIHMAIDMRLARLQQAAAGRAPAAPLEPKALLQLAENGARRLVRNSLDLLDLTVESLRRFEKRLKGETPIVRALWDENGGEPEPKGETFLSDMLVDHLRIDLKHRAVVADREVEIRPRLQETPGERTDIRIQAFKKDASGSGHHEIADLIVEVKGCWNKDVFTSMKSQLHDRYLKSTSDKVAAYVVGWYVCNAWKTPRVAGLVERKARARRDAQRKLDSQALKLAGVATIKAIILDATLS